jgi:ribosome recycling factor
MAIDDILLDVEANMEAAAEYLKKEFRGVRTGRASSGLVEHIKVNYYGAPTELRALASISTPEAALIVIKPFDPNSVKDIERGIQASELGVTPTSDGKVIRLVLPPLSMERRQHLTAQIKKMAEAARVGIRNARRDGNKEIDRQESAKELTEDDARKAKDQTQKLTEKYEALVSEVLDAKTAEIQER